MEVVEIKKNGQKIVSIESIGNDHINNPIEIKFIIDESDYQKLEYITSYYKWSIYDALSMFCEHANEIVEEMEFKLQTGEYSTKEDSEEIP